MVGRITECRLCSGPIKSLHNFGTTALANEYLADETASLNQEQFPLHLVQCEQCRHVQLDYSVDPTRLFGEYSYTSGTTRTFRNHLSALAKEINRDYPKANLIEIGSNDGTLLNMLNGPRKAIGVEPAKNLETHNTIKEFWTPELAKHMRERHGRFEVVLALNVFAHIDDIQSFTHAVQDVMLAYGAFIFEVAHLESMIENGHYGTCYHEHLDYHSIDALIPFLGKHNMSIRGWKRIPSQGGSIRVYATKGTVPIGGEKELSLDVKRWAKGIKAHGKELAAAVKKLKPIGAFGAPARGTTILANAKLTRAEIPVVYDDNPLKANKHMPGKGIPIRPTNEIPDGATLLLLSWNYLDEVKKRFPRCKFLVPFPNVRVV